MTFSNARSSAPGVSSASTSRAMSRKRWYSAGSSIGRRVCGLRFATSERSDSVGVYSNERTRGDIDRIKRVRLTISVDPRPNGLPINIIERVLSGRSSESRAGKESKDPFFSHRYSVTGVPYCRPSSARGYPGSRRSIRLCRRVTACDARKDRHGKQ